MSHKEQFIEIIKNEEWLMELLKLTRSLNLPDWFFAAGVVRNTVWDVLHDYKERTPLNDLDLVYFDPSEKIKEEEVEKKLKELRPEINWEVVNQATAHKFNNREKATSCCNSIAKWTETPTCIGVRLEKDDSITVCAELGLDDLMEMKVRPGPDTPQELYHQRMEKKQWKKIWPKLQIM